MRAGDLDRRVTIRRSAGSARDASGHPVRNEIDVATVWAHRAPVSDGERLRAQQQGASLTDRFTLRWSDQVKDVGPKDQLVCEGRSFSILGVKELGRREWLEITAQARAD